MHTQDLLQVLQKDPLTNAWPIQDLSRWPARCQVFTSGGEADLAFLLISGHPACHDSPAVILGGDPQHAAPLLKNLPKSPYVIRETPGSFRTLLETSLPKAIVYPEVQMLVTRESFKPVGKGETRRLTLDDAIALAEFFGNPAAAAEMNGWLAGGVVYGVVVEGKVLAIASSIVRLPDIWVLASIQTHREHRRKGYGIAVTSALTGAALEQAPKVSLTVQSDNAAAVGLYEKLGYRRGAERIWVDCGTGTSPSAD